MNILDAYALSHSSSFELPLSKITVPGSGLAAEQLSLDMNRTTKLNATVPITVIVMMTF
jgi:hypothetical protein